MRMHRAEPDRQVAVAAHREPGARGVVDAAVGRGERREDRADEQQHHQRPLLPVTRAASNSGVPAWPRYSQGIRPDADIPGERRGDQQRHDAGHRAEGQRAGRRAHLFGRLRGALDAEIVPEAEMHAPRRCRASHRAAARWSPPRSRAATGRHAELHREEQDDDGDEGEGGDDEVEVERRQHAAIVQPGERTGSSGR